MRAFVVVLLAAAWIAPAAAEPAPSPPVRLRRVVLVDRDPELRSAMEQTLAPWQLEVVIELAPPRNAAEAKQRADADTARFVVWRAAGALMVYDRERNSLDRRASQAGVLDGPTAAAAALTIKTMMRLPPPPAPEPEPTAPVDAPPPPAAPPAASAGVRVQAGLATRLGSGDAAGSTRFAGAVMFRPQAASWRLGLVGDAGSSTDVDQASFKGTWSDWAVLAAASWMIAYEPWAIEPYIGFGVRRSLLDGAEMSTPRSESDTLTTARIGVWLRWYHPHWSVGAAVDIDGTFSTPTYTKTGSPALIFQVPGLGINLGALVAVEL